MHSTCTGTGTCLLSTWYKTGSWHQRFHMMNDSRRVLQIRRFVQILRSRGNSATCTAKTISSHTRGAAPGRSDRLLFYKLPLLRRCMQCSDEHSVCPSVCLSVKRMICDKNERKSTKHGLKLRQTTVLNHTLLTVVLPCLALYSF